MIHNEAAIYITHKESLRYRHLNEYNVPEVELPSFAESMNVCMYMCVWESWGMGEEGGGGRGK